MDRSVKVLQSLLRVARPAILAEFRADSCIGSTRIGMDVLDHFGLYSEALPVYVMVWNPAYAERVARGEPHPETVAELDVWVKESGAWNVGLGLGGDKQPGKWPGHLVLLAEKKYLLDLSLDQVNRPQHDITLMPAGMPVSEAFISGEEPKILGINRCVVKYTATPSNIGYTVSPDWSLRTRRVNIVRTIIKAIEEEVNG